MRDNMISQTTIHYRISEKLGAGGMGNVYLARLIGYVYQPETGHHRGSMRTTTRLTTLARFQPAGQQEITRAQ